MLAVQSCCCLHVCVNTCLPEVFRSSPRRHSHSGKAIYKLGHKSVKSAQSTQFRAVSPDHVKCGTRSSKHVSQTRLFPVKPSD